MRQVSEKAVLARVRRKLARAGEGLRFTKEPSLAPYYVVDSHNTITSSGHDLEDLAKEIGCLRPFERLAYPET